MGFYLKIFSAIGFYLVLILANSSGEELIVLRHPDGENDYGKKLTCLAEDDDSALIWNYNPIKNKLTNETKSLPDFLPKNLWAPHVAICAIWNLTKCSVQWNHTVGWQPVSSIIKPMAPVFDFRWEGFTEFVFYDEEKRDDYLYVGKVNGSSGVAVFSVRGSKNIFVSLCTIKEVTAGRCFRIMLGGSNGTQSPITSCVNKTPRSEQTARYKNCRDQMNITHAASDYLDEYEWRTFIIKWDGAEKTIKVFRNDDKKPFLQTTDFTLINELEIFVGGAAPSRIRFHFYEYFSTDNKNLRLSTEKLKEYHKIVSFKLLVGLCRECELSITLEDDDRDRIETWNIYGNETRVINELLAWQSVKLNVSLENLSAEYVRLVIQTALADKNRTGYWAVDSFRISESRDGMRESTLFIGRKEEGRYRPPWLPANCQKLSYKGSALVDAFSTAQYRNTSQLQKFLRGWKEPSILGEKWFICDQTGCTCDRGFQGSNCSTPCINGSYGFNCKEECTSCYNNNCTKEDGYCLNGCRTFGFLPPICRKKFLLAEPTVTDINDTTATLIQELRFGANVSDCIKFIVTEIESVTGNHIKSPTTCKSGTTCKEVISDLKSNTRYKVQTFVLKPEWQSGEAVSSSEIFFSTTCMGKHQFEILPGETNVTVTMSSRDKNCQDLSAEAYRFTLSDVFNTPKCNRGIPKFPETCSMLLPYTEYVIRIVEGVQERWTRKFRTLSSVPKKAPVPRQFPKDHGILVLRWDYPFLNELSIKGFRIHVKYLSTNLRARPDIPIAMDMYCSVTKQGMYYKCKLHLLTATNYEFGVVAVNQHNVSSPESKFENRIPASVAFANGEELHATHSGTSITLKVPEVINATTNTSVRIFVKDLTMDMQNQSQSSSSEWLANEYQVEESQSKYVTIDCNQNENVTSNCSLRVGGTYRIEARVRDWYTDSPWIHLSLLPIKLTEDEQNLAWLIIFPIIAILLLLIFMWHRKHRKSRNRGEDLVPLSSTVTNTERSITERSITERSITEHTLHTPKTFPKAREDQISMFQSTPDVVPYNPHSQSIEVKEFEEYTREAIASGLLSSQYETLSSGVTKSCDYGKLPENLLKNRYKNLIPYDDTRVILDKIPGDHYSDYINASYIKGYKKDKAYIATQGPMPHTVNDFWRMIWQEKVQVICMLTNVTETGKRMCEEYWPPVETGMKYGDLLVSNTDHEVFADYTIRTFNLSNKYKDRKIMHLHYTGWPDHGVPMYSQSLVAYLKKLLATPTGNRPIVVHCSAGIGRTGTIILCEICLRQAVRERILDVLSVIIRMREDRVDMVNSVQQYMLAHLAIMESLVYEQTQIPCNPSLQKKIKELRKQLPADMERLTDSVWQDRALHSLAVTRQSISNNVANNIISEFVPPTPTVVEFNRDSTFDSESNYINAVSVDGVKMKKQYLESQLPSSFTLSEYWRLIAEMNIELILILQMPNPNDPMCCEIMSSDSIFVPVPYIQVEAKSAIDEEEHFTTQKLLMTDKSGKTRQQPITVLRCTVWGRGKNGNLPTPEALVSLWMASEKISRKEAPTLVLCHDGVTGCGLYLALSFLLERMAVERECDVISAVRAVRRSRTEFVQSLNQFDYLYDAAVIFFECFQTYANFS